MAEQLAKYWKKHDDNLIICELCPHNCKLKNHQNGICGVRQNIDGKLYSLVYGKVCGLSVDPIEKKPLYHFLPGSEILSFGTVGCNLSCEFCQNWHLSQVGANINTTDIRPSEIIQVAKKENVQSIAFTYNEPIIFTEYAQDVAQLCKEEGMFTVAVTAGYIKDKAREEFFKNITAANVDLKAFSDKFYKKLCHVNLQPILETLLYLKRHTNVWLELTTLLIPGENDSEDELNEMSEWVVSNLGEEVPWHFSAYRSAHKYKGYLSSTPAGTLYKARNIASQKGMKYVYTGNIFDSKSSSTYCPTCGSVLIERAGYATNIENFNKNQCRNCKTKIAGIFK